MKPINPIVPFEQYEATARAGTIDDTLVMQGHRLRRAMGRLAMARLEVKEAEQEMADSVKHWTNVWRIAAAPKRDGTLPIMPDSPKAKLLSESLEPIDS